MSTTITIKTTTAPAMFSRNYEEINESTTSRRRAYHSEQEFVPANSERTISVAGAGQSINITELEADATGLPNEYLNAGSGSTQLAPADSGDTEADTAFVRDETVMDTSAFTGTTSGIEGGDTEQTA